MNFNEYQQAASRTANTSLSQRERMIQAVFGLNGETGEVTDALKKFLFHSHDLNYSTVAEEISDCLWYIAELCSALGISLDDVAEANIAKLQARYPVAFDAERSRNRSDIEFQLAHTGA